MSGGWCECVCVSWFKISPLTLSMICLGVVLFVFILLEVHFWICRLMLFSFLVTEFWKYLAMIASFLFLPLFLSFWDSFTYMLIYFMPFHVSEALFIVFSILFSFCSSAWIIFIDPLQVCWLFLLLAPIFYWATLGIFHINYCSIPEILLG